MSSKHEWRKHEKPFYLPKTKPELIEIPEFKFIAIKGQGNPNNSDFSNYVEALYSLAYGIKMNLKKLDCPPKNYVDFTVYPLEGEWDITDEAKAIFDGEINKDDLVYELMIRQPEYVDEVFFNQIKTLVKAKKSNALIDSVEFKVIKEGPCVQMLHLGPFEDEPASFAQMERFAEELGISRLSKLHREIYLSDPRRVTPDKYKTVLRFKAQPTK
ncbi:GyrI-like domain-containing protein [Vibrio astriarenae]|uniref:GyrI-like domain-containing protein n=1 Tax=Vibrio astriarenae TaxID=1481923 RepID=UPI003735582A